MSAGKGAFISEVSKDRLWRDYVAREENHQNYWAVEAQYVKGSLSPEKKHILRSVDAVGGGNFDTALLLSTARGPSPNATAVSGTGPGSATTRHYNSMNTIQTNANPNAPSNLLLRQLQMTATENQQAEAKTLEALQQYRHNYSSRAGLKHMAALKAKAQQERESLEASSPTMNGSVNAVNPSTPDDRGETPTSKPASPLSGTRNNVAFTPVSPNATLSSTYRLNNGSGAISPLEKEKTLNNAYCSYYAGRDIGIHHYKYSPQARSCQGMKVNIVTTVQPLTTASASPVDNDRGNNNEAHDSPSRTVVTPNTVNTFNGSLSPPSHNNGCSPNNKVAPTATTVNGRSLPPLSLNPNVLSAAAAASRHNPTNAPLSPFCSSRVYNEVIECDTAILSPKRDCHEHGLLDPKMGVRIASATARRGYGQRIASSNDAAYAPRPRIELNEKSTHGYHKWN